MKQTIRHSRVLVVGTSSYACDYISQHLQEYVEEIVCIASCDDAYKSYKKVDPDIIIFSPTEDEIEGLALSIRQIKHTNYRQQIVLISDAIHNEELVLAIGEGVDKLLIPPVNEQKLLETMYECVSLVRDDLTGLFSKEELFHDLEKSFEQTLILCDIDNLEYLNSSYGYEFGNAVIQKVSDFLYRFKPADSSLYYVSGDLFGIVVHSRDIRIAEEFATILNVLCNDEKICVNGVCISTSFSIGIAKGQGTMLMANAGTALSEAKHSGKMSYALYSDDSKIESMQRTNLIWMNRVKEALNTEMVQPWYQPIINNKTMEVEKFECLARLIESDDVVSPGLFLEPARQVGLLPNISYAIVNASFKAFQDNKYEFSINVTEEDLRSGKFVHYITNRCKHYNIEPARVVIEVLESIGSNKSYVVHEQLRLLKREGFQLALDDFGTESSNFSRILELDVDYIKIDGSFIKNIAMDNDSYKITKTIADFSKSIGAKVIAEYVHSEGTLNTVRDLGIDYSQGFVIGQPSPKLMSVADFKSQMQAIINL